MFFDIISIIWQTFWGMITALGTVIWELLPEILQLRQIAAYLTPTGVVALWLGVPIFVITIAKFILKKLVNG